MRYAVTFNGTSEHEVEIAEGSIADAIAVAKKEFRELSADLVTDVSAHLIRQGGNSGEAAQLRPRSAGHHGQPAVHLRDDRHAPQPPAIVVAAAQPAKELAVNDLIEALVIFRKYAQLEYPTHCEHDVMWVNVDPAIVSEEDKRQLEALSFITSRDGDSGFLSFRFGSS